MKIEAGKYYKTRDGNKAYVVGIAPEELKLGFPALGYTFSGGVICGTTKWTIDGHMWANNASGPDEIISEWPSYEALARKIQEKIVIKYSCAAQSLLSKEILDTIAETLESELGDVK